MIALFRLAFLLAAGVSFVMAVLPKPPALPGEPPDKVLHILAFSALGGLAAVAFPRRSVAQLLLALTLFGGLIEAVQAIPALNRDSEFLDLLADSLAALVATWIVRRVTARHLPGGQGLK